MSKKLFVGFCVVSACQGSPQFSKPTELFLGEGSAPRELLSLDLEQDGDLDLLVVDAEGVGSVELRLFENQGDGSMVEGTGFLQLENFFEAEVGDLNGDGATDLLVRISGRDDEIRLNQGDGTFSAPLALVTDLEIDDVAAQTLTFSSLGESSLADVDNDGDLDLIGSSKTSVLDFSGQGSTEHKGLGLLLNNGDGTFAPLRSFGVLAEGEHSTTGDFTGDGLLDVVLSSLFRQNEVALFVNQGGGSFAEPVLLPTPQLEGSDPITDLVGLDLFTVSGDFDGDLDVDLAFNTARRFFDGTDEEDHCVITLLRNQGNGVFSSPEILLDLDSFSSQALLARDFDGDGATELIAGNSYSRRGLFSFFTQNGEMEKKRSDLFDRSVSVDLLSLISDDFNGDGVPDLAAVSPFSFEGGSLLIWLTKP